MPTAGGGRHRLRPQRLAADPCAKVMPGHVLQSYATAIAIHHMPDNIFVDAITQTVFCLGTFTPWTPVLSNNGATVTFTAPGTQMLLPGDSFYINIYFSGEEGSSVTFTGGWSQEAVPEPLTLSPTASGVLTIAVRRCRRWLA